MGNYGSGVAEDTNTSVDGGNGSSFREWSEKGDHCNKFVFGERTADAWQPRTDQDEWKHGNSGIGVAAADSKLPRGYDWDEHTSEVPLPGMGSESTVIGSESTVELLTKV